MYTIVTFEGTRRRVLVPADIEDGDAETLEAWAVAPPDVACAASEIVGPSWPYAEPDAPVTAPVAAPVARVLPSLTEA